MSKKNQRHIECEEGSGNVFADLGLEAADELFTRAQMGFHVYTILKDNVIKRGQALNYEFPLGTGWVRRFLQEHSKGTNPAC